MLALGIFLLESSFMFGAFEMKYKYSNLYKVEVSGCVRVLPAGFWNVGLIEPNV